MTDCRHFKNSASPRLIKDTLARVGFALIPLIFGVAPIVAAQAGNEFFVIGTHDNNVVVLDPRTDEIVAQIPTRGQNPLEVLPGPKGNVVYVTTDGREKIEVIDVARRQVVDSIKLSSPQRWVRIFGMAIDREGSRLFVHVKCVRREMDELRVEAPQVWAIDLPTRKITKIVDVPWGVTVLLAPGDARRLYAYGTDIYVIDIPQGRIIKTIPHLTRETHDQGSIGTSAYPQYEQSGIFSMVSSTEDPITKKKFVGLANFDVETGEEDQMDLGPPMDLNTAVVSPDRRWAYAILNKLLVVDLLQRRVVAVKDLPRTVGQANITEDGKKLYLTGNGPFILVYDTETLNLLKTIELSAATGNSLLRAVTVDQR